MKCLKRGRRSTLKDKRRNTETGSSKCGSNGSIIEMGNESVELIWASRKNERGEVD